MNGRVIGLGLLVLALVAGGAMYYLQVYAFYDTVALRDGDLTLVSADTGEPEAIPAARIEAIDATSSPLRFRACFDTPLSRATTDEMFVPYEGAEPLTAPRWFDCFDAERIGEALARDEASAYLGQKNIAYGVDRVFAVLEDGRGYAWHQLNHCGELAYDGTPVGEECPPREEDP